MTHFTPIQQEDIPVLQALAKRTYTHAFAHKNKPGVLEVYLESAFAKAHLEKQLFEPHAFWYFIKNNDTIVGYLKLNTEEAQTEFKQPDGLEIERIYIDVPYLRQRFGKKAIDFAISEAIKRVTGHDIGNESLAILCPKLGEFGINPRHVPLRSGHVRAGVHQVTGQFKMAPDMRPA